MMAVILAAGIASRLRPLTDTTPKALLPVGGVPLLQRALSALRSEGITDVVLVTGYLHEMIERQVRAFDWGLRITFVLNDRFDRTGNNYSLWLAKREVSGSAIVLLDADILFDRSILSALLREQHADALVVRRSDHLGTEEIKVECDSAGYVVRISKEIDPRAAAGESLGLEKFSAQTARLLFECLERRCERNEFYEASFQEIIDGGARILAVDAGPLPCMEIDTPEDLRAADLLARDMAF